MCHYYDLPGEGAALASQLLTLVSIAAGIAFWVLVYRWQRVDLRPYALPIALWAVFGTLDILITARGTLDDPLREGNPLARELFVAYGFWGPAIASVLWIALWSLIVLAINIISKKSGALNAISTRSAPHSAPSRFARFGGFARFASLSVFYSLAIGHLFGFGSWYCPLGAISDAYRLALPWLPNLAKIVLIGCLAGGASYLISKRLDEI